MKDTIQIDHLALARRIRAAGCPIFIGEDDGARACIPSGELRVRLTGGVCDSTVFDSGAGTGIMIYLVITSINHTIAISSFELELPWEQKSFRWLEDPLVIDGLPGCYRFSGPEPLEFERSQVLNHRLDVTVPLSAGQSVRGHLLGFGDPMPQEIRHGDMIPTFIIFYDQRGREFRAGLELWADRSEQIHRRLQLKSPRRGRLFDKPDVRR